MNRVLFFLVSSCSLYLKWNSVSLQLSSFLNSSYSFYIKWTASFLQTIYILFFLLSCSFYLKWNRVFFINQISIRNLFLFQFSLKRVFCKKNLELKINKIGQPTESQPNATRTHTDPTPPTNSWSSTTASSQTPKSSAKSLRSLDSCLNLRPTPRLLPN